MKLGFQQKDPASDLRGAGIAGVRHLTCFLRSHDAEYRAATAAGPDHCVALASLNLTLLLRAYLQLNLDGETLQPVCRGGNLRGSPEMRRRFLAWEQDTGNAFEYLHGTLLAYMLGRWVKRLANPKTNLLHFGEVLVETRDLMGRVMPRLPVPWSSPQALRSLDPNPNPTP